MRRIAVRNLGITRFCNKEYARAAEVKMLTQDISQIALIAKVEGIGTIHNQSDLWRFGIKLRGIVDFHNLAVVAWQ